jgi:hypothetical protein
MSHLTLETIARLVEEEPTRTEASHLQECEECRAVLDAMHEDLHALTLLPDIEPAPYAWPALEARLEAEGLIRRRRLFSPGRLSWAAAAMVVFMAGGLAGRMSADVTQPSTDARPVASTEPASGAQPVAGPQQPAPDTHPDDLAGQPWAEPQPREPALALPDPPVERTAPRGSDGVRLASSDGAPGLPRTIDDAAALLRHSEAAYLAALTRYAELAASSEPGDPIARLAALQSIVITTQAALTQSPTDPVINGYHLTALAQRDATLRQVAATSNERWY